VCVCVCVIVPDSVVKQTLLPQEQPPLPPAVVLKDWKILYTMVFKQTR
jgi:hypothetical protein